MLGQLLLAWLLPIVFAAPAADSSAADKSNKTRIDEWIMDLATLPYDHAGMAITPTQTDRSRLGRPPYVETIPNHFALGREQGLICDFPEGMVDGAELLYWLPQDLLKPVATGRIQILNFPAYANWTDDGTWSIRIRAFVHEALEIGEETLEYMMWDWPIGFGPELNLKEGDMSPEELRHYANITQSLLLLGQDCAGRSIDLEFASDMGFEVKTGETSLVVNPVSPKYPDFAAANRVGDINAQLLIDNVDMRGLNVFYGNGTQHVQRLNMDVSNGLNGNSTAYLVPEEGITILSDVDDTLRDAKIWNCTEMLTNTFVRPFQPFMNMPEVLAGWAAAMPTVHFHYLSSVPEQFGRQYLDWMIDTYPGGSHDMRPNEGGFKFRGGSVRKHFMNQIFDSFPRRKFVLVGDTTNPSTLSSYPSFYKKNPGQVLCILIRNVTDTEPWNWLGYDTSDFVDIPEDHYMFFSQPNDLLGLDIANGDCRNHTIKHTVLFEEQDGFIPEGRDEGTGCKLSPTFMSLLCLCIVMTSSMAVWDC